MDGIEKVAVLALTYRTMHRERYEGAVSLFEDMEGYPDGISLLGMIGSHALAEADWDIVAYIDRAPSPGPLACELAAVEPVRAEAILHAWPHDPREEFAGAEWAQPYIERWELVEAMMTGLEPLTWNRERTEEAAQAALRPRQHNERSPA